MKTSVDSLLHPSKTLGFDEMKPALVLLRDSPYISASVFTARAASGNAPSALSTLSLDSIVFILCNRQTSKALRITPEEM